MSAMLLRQERADLPFVEQLIDPSAYYIGIDIGGTKTAVILGAVVDDEITVLQKARFETDKSGWEPNLEAMRDGIDRVLQLQELTASDVTAIGVSCGGPLDSDRGLIQSPPNLPLWDNVPICALLREAYGVPCFLQNDANACALAEWKFGAGQGTRNMVFLTFGTGFGAGLILDGRLYAGTNGNAGEVGHIRLAEFGPTGYGKIGSWEGFCSGSGIAQLGRTIVTEELQNGHTVGFCASAQEIPNLNAKIIGDAADEGDPVAQRIYALSGRYLGKGLAMMIDFLNPQAIVIGSIFARSGQWLWPAAREVIEREALGVAQEVCRVVPAALGESIGDIAALAVACSV